MVRLITGTGRINTLIAPLILLLSLEVMHLAHVNTIMKFFSSQYFPVKLLLTYLFLLSLQSFFYTMTQSSFFANFINTFLMFGITYSSEALSRVNGNPLLPTDLLLLKNVKDIASFAEVPFFI